MPIGEAANPCPQTWIAEKTFTDFFFVFQQAEFLCVRWNNHITQLARRKGLRKGEKEYGCCLLNEMKDPLNSSHP